MGVLNVTPDSFSDGGNFFDVDCAVKHALELTRAGADIIDIGGESTRPGSATVSAEEELRRVIPIIEHLTSGAPGGHALPLTISVDTTKAVVAERALAAGAQIVNDISAFDFDSRMASVVRESGAGVVLMHMQGTPQTMQKDPHYTDVVKEVREFLDAHVNIAVAAGINLRQIAIDPGIGFGKNLKHNLQLLARLGELRSHGLPLLVGVSRKAFIGQVLGKEVTERQWGTAACVAWATIHGASILRVHDVSETKQVVQMIEAIRAVECKT